MQESKEKQEGEGAGSEKGREIPSFIEVKRCLEMTYKACDSFYEYLSETNEHEQITEKDEPLRQLMIMNSCIILLHKINTTQDSINNLVKHVLSDPDIKNKEQILKSISSKVENLNHIRYLAEAFVISCTCRNATSIALNDIDSTLPTIYLPAAQNPNHSKSLSLSLQLPAALTGITGYSHCTRTNKDGFVEDSDLSKLIRAKFNKFKAECQALNMHINGLLDNTSTTENPMDHLKPLFDCRNKLIEKQALLNRIYIDLSRSMDETCIEIREDLSKLQIKLDTHIDEAVHQVVARYRPKLAKIDSYIKTSSLLNGNSEKKEKKKKEQQKKKDLELLTKYKDELIHMKSDLSDSSMLVTLDKVDELTTEINTLLLKIEKAVSNGTPTQDSLQQAEQAEEAEQVEEAEEPNTKDDLSTTYESETSQECMARFITLSQEVSALYNNCEKAFVQYKQGSMLGRITNSSPNSSLLQVIASLHQPWSALRTLYNKLQATNDTETDTGIDTTAQKSQIESHLELLPISLQEFLRNPESSHYESLLNEYGDIISDRHHNKDKNSYKIKKAKLMAQYVCMRLTEKNDSYTTTMIQNLIAKTKQEFKEEKKEEEGEGEEEEGGGEEGEGGEGEGEEEEGGEEEGGEEEGGEEEGGEEEEGGGEEEGGEEEEGGGEEEGGEQNACC